MSSITEILKIKGDREFLVECNDKGSAWMSVEGGGLYKDYEYLISLNKVGHRCGYVAIPKNHKYADTPIKKYYFAGKEIQDYDYESLKIECHGGLSFMADYHKLKKLLSVPCADMWIGFDCGHYGDQSDYDALEKYFGKEYKENKLKYCSRDDDGQVRTYYYVEQQCHSIIDQLIKNSA